MTMTDGPSSERPQDVDPRLRPAPGPARGWLQERVPGATVSELIVPESNGMSSETVLFDLTVPGEPEPRGLVARIAPDPAADPVFQTYDMERQFRTMQMVAEHTDVPVPDGALAGERHRGHRGALLRHGAGGRHRPPRRAALHLRRQLVLRGGAGRPAAPGAHRGRGAGRAARRSRRTDPAAFLAGPDDGASHLRHHVDEQRAYYDWVAADGVRSPLIERGFEWLEEHWPDNEDDAVFSWGDARVGNMMFEDFAPVAVLDWEMASVGPREIDLGWMIYIHRFFQDLVEDLGLPGMPHILRRDTVADLYESLTGYHPRDLDFYTAYAALRHGIVMFRITRRSIRFGEAEMPEDPDHAILHHAHLARMLDGVYWGEVKG